MDTLAWIPVFTMLWWGFVVVTGLLALVIIGANLRTWRRR